MWGLINKYVFSVDGKINLTKRINLHIFSYPRFKSKVSVLTHVCDLYFQEYNRPGSGHGSAGEVARLYCVRLLKLLQHTGHQSVAQRPSGGHAHRHEGKYSKNALFYTANCDCLLFHIKSHMPI